ncbi:hypothetical protein EVAR_28399_1 [Eumeta japonica]|uniref:Uncharacterized protein n=1 Tax=Eumeta variegata TaxID=151549 RepID=A0A4C1XDL3_EUMVA|nr:hypothetical protein EVAR_28399_1 [Eumeta japonica]
MGRPVNLYPQKAGFVEGPPSIRPYKWSTWKILALVSRIYRVNMEVSDNSRVASTDFSIERILSEEPRERRLREDGCESTSWLCCTRYRPPKLPR